MARGSVLGKEEGESGTQSLVSKAPGGDMRKNLTGRLFDNCLHASPYRSRPLTLYCAALELLGVDYHADVFEYFEPLDTVSSLSIRSVELHFDPG